MAGIMKYLKRYCFSYVFGLILIVVSGCAPEQTSAPLVITVQPTLVSTVVPSEEIIATETMTAAVIEQTATPEPEPENLLPVGAGTPIPLSDEMITADSLQELQLLSSWQTYPVNSLAISEDNQLLAVASGDYWAQAEENAIQLWRLVDGVLINAFYGHNDVVNDVAFSPDGTILASASSDRTIKLWRISDGMLLQTLDDDRGYVTSLAFSPDGTLLAAGSNEPQLNGSVRVWSVTQNDSEGLDVVKLYEYEEGYGRVNDVVYSRDGELLASCAKGIVHFWRASDGRNLRNLEEGRMIINSLDFSQDAEIVVTGEQNGVIHVWQSSREVQDDFGKLLLTEGEAFSMSGDIVDVAYSPVDDIFFTASKGVVRVWQVDRDYDGEKLSSVELVLLEELEGFGGSTYRIDLSSDGRLLVMGLKGGIEERGMVQVWGLKP